MTRRATARALNAALARDGEGTRRRVTTVGAALAWVAAAALWSLAGAAQAGPSVEQVTATPRTAGDLFGFAVAIGGERAVVAAPGRQVGVYTAAGVVFPLTRGPDGWLVEAPLDEPDTVAYGRALGLCAALGDEVLALCAPGYTASGAVLLFHLVDGAWVRDTAIYDTPATASDRLGVSVAASGATVVMGSTIATIPVMDMQPGRARVFAFDQTWSEQDALLPTDSEGGDRFGYAVAIDGDVAVVGAPGKEMSRGAAYVFVRAAGLWTQTAKLVAEDRQPSDLFGASVAIAGDVIVVGAYGRDEAAGAAYVFEKPGEAWTQTQRLTAAVPTAGELFGETVAVTPGYALISGYGYERVEPYGPRGGAYLYGRLAGGYGLLTTLRGDATVPGDYVGYAAALAGSTALLGAPYDDAPTVPTFQMGMALGAAYLFEPAQEAGEACVLPADCVAGASCCEGVCVAGGCEAATTGEADTGSGTGGPTTTTTTTEPGPTTGGPEESGPPAPEIDPLSAGCGCDERAGRPASWAALGWVLVGVPRRRRR